MGTQLLRFAAACSATLALAASTSFGVDSAADMRQDQNRTAGEDIQVMHVQGNVHMIVGAGANIAASVGQNGVLLVDSGNAASADGVLAAVRGLSPKLPIHYIINTQFKQDHTGGNETIARAGRRLRDTGSTQAVILAHEKILNRMSAPAGGTSPRPVGAWPTDTFFAPTKEVFFNGEAVILHHRPGHTDGDTFVFFRKSDVIAAGDLYINTTFPIIDVEAGGHINGVIEGLNDILDIVVPANNVEDGTLVVPGEGRLADELDVAEYRDMVTIVRDRIQDAIRRGQTLAQVKGDKRIVLEYEARYGGKGTRWTTEMFLDAAYRNLTAKP